MARAIALTQEKTPASLAEAKALVATGSFVGEELRQARVLRCEIALAEHAAAEFVSCSEGLAQDFPTSPEALYYAHHGQLAVQRFARARSLLEAAREQGLPPALYEEARAKLDTLAPSWWPWLAMAGGLLAAGIVLAFKPWRKARV